jgi:hypothetical protein
MSVDTHVPSSSTQTLSFSVRNMLSRLGITVLLGHTEIDNVDDCAERMDTFAHLQLRQNSLFAPLVPGRPIRKLSGFMSR